MVKEAVLKFQEFCLKEEGREEAALVAPVFNENQMKRNEKLLTLILHLFGQQHAQEAAHGWVGGVLKQAE